MWHPNLNTGIIAPLHLSENKNPVAQFKVTLGDVVALESSTGCCGNVHHHYRKDSAVLSLSDLLTH